jgi:hypothetical protein
MSKRGVMLGAALALATCGGSRGPESPNSDSTLSFEVYTIDFRHIVCAPPLPPAPTSSEAYLIVVTGPDGPAVRIDIGHPEAVPLGVSLPIALVPGTDVAGNGADGNLFFSWTPVGTSWQSRTVTAATLRFVDFPQHDGDQLSFSMKVQFGDGNLLDVNFAAPITNTTAQCCGIGGGAGAGGHGGCMGADGWGGGGGSC